MNYGIYKNARNAAWQCIIDFNIGSLPVKVSNIARDSDITIVKNSKVNILNSNTPGRTVLQNNKFYIVYQDNDSVERCRFTIAHELGHIFLGHLIVNNTFSYNADTEHAANVFARDLLAPACVLHELQVLEANKIAELCNISLEAATYRAKRMQELEKRNAYYLHPLEREVISQFKDFINQK